MFGQAAPCEQLEHACTIKLLLVGESAVGKNSLMYRFVDNIYDDHFIGKSFDDRNCSVDLDGQLTQLEIWKGPGQPRFRTANRNNYPKAHGITIAYDVTDQNSFDNVKQFYLDEIDSCANKHVSKLLVGNKSDLKSERVVDCQTAKALADEIGVSFLETSAKDSSNVEQAFLTIAAKVKQTMADSPTADLPAASPRTQWVTVPGEGRNVTAQELPAD